LHLPGESRCSSGLAVHGRVELADDAQHSSIGPLFDAEA
jgi:hypothetical protein